MKKINPNNKRSNIMSMKVRQNIELSKQIESYIESNELGEENESFLIKFRKRLGECAAYSLYESDRLKAKYYGSLTCKHKCCPVCNWRNQKIIRRRYFKWFKQNEQIVVLTNAKGNHKYITENQFKNLEKRKGMKGYNSISRRKYDLMHLVLTVPHTKENGFLNDRYYFRKIRDKFRAMRKLDFWNEFIYGGEYGIETTKGRWHYCLTEKETGEKKEVEAYELYKMRKNKELDKYELSDKYLKEDNGLHIHIHALLLVKRQTQSRNILFRDILMNWNRLTVDANNESKVLTEYRRQNIKKICSLMTDEDLDKIDTRGATLINLETVYGINERGEKVRATEFNSEAMIKAVMETISYHFEPHTFDKKTKEFDLDLLSELLPRLHGEHLYERFGCLRFESSLRTDDVSIIEEYEETKEESESNEMNDSEYLILHPSRVFHDKDKDFKIKISQKAKREAIKIVTDSPVKALDQMISIYVAKKKKAIG